MVSPDSTTPAPVSAADRTIELPKPIGHLRATFPALIFGASLVFLAEPPRMSGNVWSRYMTIESIVERGTLAVDESPYLGPSGSPDLAKFRGRLYSDKPPVLPVMGAAVYGPLYASGYRMFDLSSPRSFVESFGPVNRALVAILIAIPSAMALYALRRMLQAIAIHRALADFLSIGFGFSSLLLCYGVTFNNHSVAAGLLTTAFALVLLDPLSTRTRLIRSGFAGFLAALGATIDLPAGGSVWIGLGVWLMIRSRKGGGAFLVGSALPILTHSLLQSFVTGTPLPVEMYPEALAYDGSYWATEIGTYRETIPRSWFLAELIVGPQGWFTVTPVLVFAPVGLALAMIVRRDALRSGAILVATVAGVLLTYYSFGVRRTDYSGQSFGVRHLLPITPIVFLFAVAALERLRHHTWRILFVVLMLFGSVYAVAGMQDPWSRIESRTDVPLRLAQRLVLYPYSSYNR